MREGLIREKITFNLLKHWEERWNIFYPFSNDKESAAWNIQSEVLVTCLPHSTIIPLRSFPRTWLESLKLGIDVIWIRYLISIFDSEHGNLWPMTSESHRILDWIIGVVLELLSAFENNFRKFIIYKNKAAQLYKIPFSVNKVISTICQLHFILFTAMSDRRWSDRIKHEQN